MSSSGPQASPTSTKAWSCSHPSVAGSTGAASLWPATREDGEYFCGPTSMPIYPAAAKAAAAQIKQVDLNSAQPASMGKLKPQANLTDQEFADTLQGYKKLEDVTELFEVPLGSRVRYVIDCLDDNGQFLERNIRYGGVLTVVDSSLRYIMLKNPALASSNRSKGRGACELERAAEGPQAEDNPVRVKTRTAGRACHVQTTNGGH